ncbi:T6SS protein Cts1T [Intestinirhabdus alba]|jgi:type VI secretion system protein ImpM|uniref:T6SS protein Cts1T n=1 Tax=Intestinirhabdus alba TaxID=2899544 RepID=A0A6L6IJF9_9ENTR|nr:T6SS protein Cts1T [Intestinirhabdus alba]MTH46709.1 T6SS protein Cts1T [Intestinirhabdus alba]
MSIRLYLLADKARAGLFRRSGKRQREVRALITRHVLPVIGSPLPDEALPEQYPWCFAISPAALRGRYTCVGALAVLRSEEGEASLVAICGAVSYPWLKKNMRGDFPVTFWAARILNKVQKSDAAELDGKPLRQWLKALSRAYSPFWESFALTPAWRFKNRSQALLREGSQADFYIRNHDGVEAMPWKNWPDCLQQEPGIWIWRQSRHKRILDSQRIPLRRAEATSPDAPC